MKLLALLPHGNTAAFLEQQRLSLAEKTGRKIFAFSPLYCPLAVAPENEYTAAEAKKLLVSARDAVSSSANNEPCAIVGTSCKKYGNVTAYFCSITLPFVEELNAWCQKEGFQPLRNTTPGFCVGFTYRKDAAGEILQDAIQQTETQLTEQHKMTVFQLALMEFAPKAPFFDETAGKTTPTESDSAAQNSTAETPVFEWKLINSVWKAKRKEA